MNAVDQPHDLSPPPDLSPGYPSGGARMAAAWADIWRTLSTTEPAEGITLAEDVAEAHDLKRDSLLSLMSAAARVGLLVRENIVTVGARGPRPRAHYRVNPDHTIAGTDPDTGVPYASTERV